MSKGYVDVKENNIEIIKIWLILLVKGDRYFLLKEFEICFCYLLKENFFC